MTASGADRPGPRGRTRGRPDAHGGHGAARGPRDPHERYGLGWTEWRDVDAAVRWARDAGAADVLLVGYSMGGAIVGRYVRKPDDVPVRGTILDAPVLDWDRTLGLAARDRGAPTFLTPVTYERIEGAGHSAPGTWPGTGYENAVVDFLDAVAP